MSSLASTAPVRTNQPCPPGSWDTHFHVFELPRFPLSPTRHFTPRPATTAQFEAFQHSMGIEHGCITQGLSFGADPSSTQAYLAHFGQSARAYACVNIDQVTDEQIEALKKQGVIGIRVDYHLHKAQHDVDTQIACLRRYAERVAPHGWGLEIYHPHPEFYPQLAPVIEALPVSVVVDHFGGLKTPSLLKYLGHSVEGFDSASQPGLEAICQLLRNDKLWIKLSAPYRCSEDAGYNDMQPLIRALVDANPKRVLYGSDWPHTQPFHRRPKGLKGEDIEEYLDFDDASWVRTLRSWLSDEEWALLMVHNPRQFTGYNRED